MKIQRSLSLLLVAAFLYGCGDAVLNSRSLPPESASYLISDTPLSAGISGPSKTEVEDSLSFTAGVSGGTAPYYYQWIAQPCYTDGTCRSEWIVAEGQDVSSVKVLIRSDEAEVRIGLQVREAKDLHYSGVAEHRVIGPAAFDVTTSVVFECREPNSFPHKDEKGYYARQCDGTRIYKP